MKNRPSRQEARTQQTYVSHLQDLASFKKYVTAPRPRLLSYRIDADAVVRDLQWERLQKDLSWGDRAERATGAFARKQMIGLSYGHAPRLAGAELGTVYSEAKTRALAGIARRDYRPFFFHLARLGPTLLADPELLLILDGWWRRAYAGDRYAKKRLEALAQALSPGSGRSLGPVVSVKQRRERTRARQARYRANVRKYEQDLRNSIEKKLLVLTETGDRGKQRAVFVGLARPLLDQARQSKSGAKRKAATALYKRWRLDAGA